MSSLSQSERIREYVSPYHLKCQSGLWWLSKGTLTVPRHEERDSAFSKLTSTFVVSCSWGCVNDTITTLMAVQLGYGISVGR